MTLLGVYWCPEHGRASDLDYIAALQPPWIRILDPGINHIAQVQRVAPNAMIMLRYWWLDDGNRQQMAAMAADPIGTARRHADEWAREMDRLENEARQQGLTVNRNYWWGGALNEPDPGKGPQLRDYTGELMRRGNPRGDRFGVLVFSVGNPGKPGEGPYDWNFYKPLENDINAGDNILVLHEYWQPEGVRFTWTDDQGNKRVDEGNLAWRHHTCPLQVPILIGETGANGYLFNRHSNEDNAGWQRFMQPDQYAAQVEEYARGCDKRVEGILPFLTDYRSNQWASFDTEPAHGALLARKDRMVAQTTTTHIPSIGTGPKPAPVVTPLTTEIITRTGVNVRKAPSLDAGIAQVVDPGTRFAVVGETSEFYQIAFDTGLAYVHKTVANVVTEPAPTNQQRNWERSIAFTSKWEGGYQNVHNDAGNWTGGKVGVGDLKGTNFGISAASYPHLDIKNLTRQQAHEIYRRDYWEKSGANQLAWPACLIVFDTSVLHGVGTAQAWRAEVGTSAFAFAAKRLRSYTKMGNWDYWGKAWTLRVADLLEEAAK